MADDDVAPDMRAIDEPSPRSSPRRVFWTGGQQSRLKHKLARSGQRVSRREHASTARPSSAPVTRTTSSINVRPISGSGRRSSGCVTARNRARNSNPLLEAVDEENSFIEEIRPATATTDAPSVSESYSRPSSAATHAFFGGGSAGTRPGSATSTAASWVYSASSPANGDSDSIATPARNLRLPLDFAGSSPECSQDVLEDFSSIEDASLGSTFAAKNGFVSSCTYSSDGFAFAGQFLFYNKSSDEEECSPVDSLHGNYRQGNAATIEEEGEEKKKKTSAFDPASLLPESIVERTKFCPSRKQHLWPASVYSTISRPRPKSAAASMCAARRERRETVRNYRAGLNEKTRYRVREHVFYSDIQNAAWDMPPKWSLGSRRDVNAGKAPDTYRDSCDRPATPVRYGYSRKHGGHQKKPSQFSVGALRPDPDPPSEGEPGPGHYYKNRLRWPSEPAIISPSFEASDRFPEFVEQPWNKKPPPGYYGYPDVKPNPVHPRFPGFLLKSRTELPKGSASDWLNPAPGHYDLPVRRADPTKPRQPEFNISATLDNEYQKFLADNAAAPGPGSYEIPFALGLTHPTIPLTSRAKVLCPVHTPRVRD
ncbi:unnamed protein product [Amoebophrya sp. A120]|nr:unnamed protein product [Amoebophrya sp. A120]|eukprot:GSA120T00011325001.1